MTKKCTGICKDPTSTPGKLNCKDMKCIVEYAVGIFITALVASVLLHWDQLEAAIMANTQTAPFVTAILGTLLYTIKKLLEGSVAKESK